MQLHEKASGILLGNILWQNWAEYGKWQKWYTQKSHIEILYLSIYMENYFVDEKYVNFLILHLPYFYHSRAQRYDR